MSEGKTIVICVLLSAIVLYACGIMAIVLPDVVRTNTRNSAIEVYGEIVALRGSCVLACDDDDDDFVYDPFDINALDDKLAGSGLGTNHDGLDNCGSQFNATVRYTVDAETLTGEVQATWLSNPCYSVTIGRNVSVMVDKADHHKILALEQTAGEWPPANDTLKAAGWILVILLSIALLVLAAVVLYAHCKT